MGTCAFRAVKDVVAMYPKCNLHDQPYDLLPGPLVVSHYEETIHQARNCVVAACLFLLGICVVRHMGLSLEVLNLSRPNGAVGADPKTALESVDLQFSL